MALEKTRPIPARMGIVGDDRRCCQYDKAMSVSVFVLLATTFMPPAIEVAGLSRRARSCAVGALARRRKPCKRAPWRPAIHKTHATRNNIPVVSKRSPRMQTFRISRVFSERADSLTFANPKIQISSHCRLFWHKSRSEGATLQRGHERHRRHSFQWAFKFPAV